MAGPQPLPKSVLHTHCNLVLQFPVSSLPLRSSVAAYLFFLIQIYRYKTHDVVQVRKNRDKTGGSLLDKKLLLYFSIWFHKGFLITFVQLHFKPSSFTRKRFAATAVHSPFSSYQQTSVHNHPFFSKPTIAVDGNRYALYPPEG
jgi:hypothetical protein